MTTPSTAQQVRDQSGGMGAIVGKSILLWLLILGGATLTWWQINSLLADIGAVLNGGAIEMRGEISTAMSLATLGVVIAVGFSVFAILATGWGTAILCVVLMFAPMAIFKLWFPIWIWWILGPFIALLFLTLLGVRSKMAAKMRFSAPAQAAVTTFWVMVLISLFAPVIAMNALQVTPDRLRPESLEPLAEWIVAHVPAEVVAAAISELPQTPAPEFTPEPPPQENPETVVDASPEATTEVAPVEPQVVTPETQPDGLPDVTPINPWGGVTQPTEPEVNTVVATPATRESRLPKANRAKQIDPETMPTQEQIDEFVNDPETARQLALGMWNALSSQGEGYAGLNSQVPIAAALVLNLLLIPFVILAPIASFILMGIVFLILRRANFVRRLTVTIEVPRYTLRGSKDKSTEGPEL